MVNILLSPARLLLSIALLATAGTIARAQVTLVSFGGDYVSANQISTATLQDFSDTPGTGNSIRQIGGFTTSANPAIGANYSGPSFRAGAQAVKYGLNSASGGASIAVNDSGANDIIALSAQTPANGSLTSQNLNYVLNWSVSTNYGALSGISASLGLAMVNSTTSRFMIGTSDGSYYLSNLSWSGGNSTQSISNPSAQTWALFTPNLSGDWSGNFGSLSSFSALAAETQVTSIGIFANRPGTSTAQINAQYNVTAFSVTSAIPEPSSFAALAGLGVLGLAAARRRRRA